MRLCDVFLFIDGIVVMRRRNCEWIGKTLAEILMLSLVEVKTGEKELRKRDGPKAVTAAEGTSTPGITSSYGRGKQYL